ncbi:glycosyltransferase family 2 protein [Bizionia paragorgiae]|uniref:glycosyltransferase family 2 protein n=1 Tax=Bizionia paragorgiae TaxID=283786 RepID=UPI003A94636D
MISIIIPTYNRASILREALDSVLAQIYQDWECIVVDDNSTDNTKEIVQEYSKKDSRFRYFERPLQMPKGANACRNYGFEQSRGEYIQWFDSDDLMHPEKLKFKIKFALFYNSDIIVDTHTSQEVIALSKNPKLDIFESADFYVDFIMGKKPVITNDVMVRRSVIGKLRYDENLHKAQEYEFFTRLFDQKLKYCFVHLPLTTYREGHDSISKNTSKGNSAQVESLIYLSELIKKRHSDNLLIVEKAERQGRKTYKSLIKKKKIGLILKHFKFFSNSHKKNSFVFSLFLIYNLITGKGFDRIKPSKTL